METEVTLTKITGLEQISLSNTQLIEELISETAKLMESVATLTIKLALVETTEESTKTANEETKY